MYQLSLKEMRQLFQKKELSPSDVLDDYVARIEKHVDANIFITVNADQARKQAKIATQRYLYNEANGLLEGIPVAYKDNIYTNALRTTSGSKIEQQFVPDFDALAVKQMQQAGAVNLGKLNLHEYAFGITSNNPFYGAVQNPWQRSHSPGGSSGGSGAALAANLAMVTLGTDTGGSVRIPAAACGVIGLKATRDLISTHGIRPISSSLDHVGPLSKTVEDMAIVLEVLTGQNYSSHLQRDLNGLRVGVPKQFFFDYIDAEVNALYESALLNLQALGAILIEVDVPIKTADVGALFALAICEGAVVHEDRLKTHQEHFGADVLGALTAMPNFSAVDYIKARQFQAELTQKFNEFFENIDVLVTPTMALPAPKVGVDEVIVNGQPHDYFAVNIHNCSPFNLTGQPAISIPCGMANNNQIPVGLQLIGANYQERLLLQVAHAYEMAYLADFYALRQQMAFA